jgi:hypothetical protein
LAERYRKKPRTTEEGEPTITADQGTAALDVADSSSQCEAVIQFSLASTAEDVLDKEMEEVRQETVAMEMPLTSTIPESSSPARTSTDEPVCTDAVPASEPIGDQVMTTNVVEEDPSSSQQTHTGDPFSLSTSPLLVGFLLLSS